MKSAFISLKSKSNTRALLVFLFSLTSVLFGKNSIYIKMIDRPPVIDGNVDEAIWSNAAVVDSFVQRIPDNGQVMTESTLFYFCFDKNNIYFAFKCYDSEPEKITANELARDASLKYDDKIHIILDTFLDHRNAYWFQINPRGCIGDALVSQNGAALNKSWDGLWSGKAHITRWGWEGEIGIPFKTMSFRSGQQKWGLKFIRQISRKNEIGYWPTANLNSFDFQVSDAGILTGLDNITQGLGLDVYPYALAGTEKNAGEKRIYPGDIGFDLFYQMTPSLKSVVTVNTDFAQTEVDDRRINLTRFPLFFEEKRDFFLDGANYLNFGFEGDQDHPCSQELIPFFSRRIGLDADSNAVPIIGGGKFFGQIGQWNLGFLDIVDEKQGNQNNYAVGRVSRNFGKQSYIGVIGTSGNATENVDNSVGGVDIKLGTSNFLGDKNMSLMLFGLKSKTAGLAGHDFSYGLSFSYPNDFVWIASGYHEIGDNFNAGIGFVRRKGIRQSYFRGGIGPRPKKWGILKTWIGPDINYITDVNNRLLSRFVGFLLFDTEFLTGDRLAFMFGNHYERLTENFKIHKNVTIPGGCYDFWRFESVLNSAQWRPFWFQADYNWGSFYTGFFQQATFTCGYKISVPIFLGLTVEHNDISLNTGDFYTDVMRFNFNILFSPDIFLYNYIQYDNLSEKMGWQSLFVWILQPGREIFLVWKSISLDPLERFELAENSIRIKIKYNIRF